jgi:N-acetylglucosamine kinase-like BadF-type ATPase
MPKAPLSILVDVGGTKIRIWAIQQKTSSQHVIKREFPSHLDLKTLLKKFISQTAQKPHSLTMGLRGVWTKQEKLTVKNKFKNFASNVEILSDIELAHKMIFRDGTGLVLNAGTGSIAYGVNQRGIKKRAGGLGPLVGDEGSAFWIGKKYLLLKSQKTNNSIFIRKYVTNPQAIKKIAALASHVLKKAHLNRRGMERQIIEEACEKLAELTLELKNKLHWHGALPLAMVGGLFKNSLFKGIFIKKLKERSLKFYLVTS